MSATATAQAQESRSAAASAHSFDIPATTLEDALRIYMRQSGVQVSWSGVDGSAVRTAAVGGTLSTAQALGRMLEGTGLTYRFTAPTSAVLEPAPRADAGTIQLGTLRVEGVSGSGGGGRASGGGGRSAGADAHSGAENRRYTSAQSTEHLSQERIERFRGTSAGDFLSGTPSVINGDNRNSGALDVNIRGMQGMDRVPVVIDGSLQQSTVYRGYAGVAGRTYLDPDLIGSVTIEKGPSAAADGVGATGGLVRAETIGANDLIAPGGGFGIRLRGGLTGNNVAPPPVATQGTGAGGPARFDRPGLLDLRGYNFSVAAAGRLGDFELVGAIARRKLGNYFGGEHGTVPPGGTGVLGNVLQRYNLGEEVLSTSQDNTSYLVRGAYRFGDGHGIDLSYSRYESDFGEMMPSQIIRFGGALQAPLSRAEVNTYTARYRWKPADNDLINVKADLWKTTSFTSIETLYRYSWSTVPQDAAYQSQSDRWGVNLSNASILGTPLGRLELNYGGSYSHERLTPPPGWQNYKNNAGFTAFVEPRDGWRKEYSAFIASELKPNDWVTFSAALRYTNTESHDNLLTQTWAGSSPQIEVTGYNHEKNAGFAPIVSLLIEPLRGLQFYARYAEAIRNPSLFESTAGFSFHPDPRYPIRPERARNTEVGANLQAAGIFAADDLLEGKLAYFSNEIDDYLTRGTSEGMNTIANIRSASFQGVEASLRYDSGTVFADLGATYYTHKMFCDYQNVCREGGTANSYVPAHLPPKFSFSANVGVRLLAERLTLGARYLHVGKRDTSIITFGGSLTTVDWRPYHLLDLYGSFDIRDNLRFDVGIDNVTDRYYMDALTLGLMPSPGRTMRIGLTAGFGGPSRRSERDARRNSIEALSAKSALADFDGDWSGAYIGLTAGHGFLGTSGETVASDGTAGGIPGTESADIGFNGSQIGLFAGHNWNLGSNWVAGVEADFTFSRANGRQYARSTELEPILFDFYAQDLSNQADTKYAHDWSSSLRARIGYKLGRALLFGTGGLALMQETQTRTQHIDRYTPFQLGIGRQFSENSVPFFAETANKVRTGWTVGGGAELALGKRWLVRGEYAYSRFGRSEFYFADARAGVGGDYLLGVSGIYIDPDTGQMGINPQTGDFFVYDQATGSSSIVTGRRARNTAETHSVRIGIGYRF